LTIASISTFVKIIKTIYFIVLNYVFDIKHFLSYNGFKGINI